MNFFKHFYIKVTLKYLFRPTQLGLLLKDKNIFLIKLIVKYININIQIKMVIRLNPVPT